MPGKALLPVMAAPVQQAAATTRLASSPSPLSPPPYDGNRLVPTPPKTQPPAASKARKYQQAVGTKTNPLPPIRAAPSVKGQTKK